MSVSGLLDSWVGVYRQSEESTDSMGDIDTPTNVGQWKGSLQLPRTGVRDEGPGERPSGMWLLFIDRRADIKIADILHIRSGPNAGKWFSIASDPYQARRFSHKEVELRPYVGKLPNG